MYQSNSGNNPPDLSVFYLDADKIHLYLLYGGYSKYPPGVSVAQYKI